MNPKIQKTISDIEKTRARIAEQQARLRELEAQKTDLENTEIISLFRSVDVAPSELAGFIRAYREQSAGAAATAAPAYGTGVTSKEEDFDDEE